MLDVGQLESADEDFLLILIPVLVRVFGQGKTKAWCTALAMMIKPISISTKRILKWRLRTGWEMNAAAVLVSGGFNIVLLLLLLLLMVTVLHVQIEEK